MTTFNPKHISWHRTGRFELTEDLVIELEANLQTCLATYTQDYSFRVRCWHFTHMESWWPSLTALLRQQQHATNPINRLQIEVVAPSQDDYARFRREDEYHEGLLNPEDTLAGSIELNCQTGHSEVIFRSRIDSPVLKDLERQVFPILDRAYFAQARKGHIPITRLFYACLPWAVWIIAIILLDYAPYIGNRNLGSLSVSEFGIWILAYFGISVIAFSLSSWTPNRKPSAFDRDGHCMWGDYGRCRQAHQSKFNAIRSKIIWGFGVCALIGGLVAAYAKDFLDALILSLTNR